MQIKITWDGFPASIPVAIRQDIIQMLSWINETPVASDELLATRASNFYLQGVNDGIRQAQRNVESVVKSFGKAGRS